MTRHNTVKDTPQQNGLAKRMSKTLLERVRRLLSTTNLPKKFWAEVVATVAYQINRSPSKAIRLKTLEEMWTVVPPKLDHLSVFGCVAYSHVKQGKLDPRAKKCMFIGYLSGVKGYKLQFKDDFGSKRFISRDVTFRQDHKYMEQVPKGSDSGTKIQGAQVQVELPSQFETSSEKQPDVIKEQEEIVYDEIDHPQKQKRYQLTYGKPKREVGPPSGYGSTDVIS